MKTPLLVVLPVHEGDIDLALKLADWMSGLGPYPDHACLIVRDATVPQEKSNALKSALARVFGFCYRQEMKTSKAYPGAATQMFKAAAERIEDSYRLPFLWLEPDAVPLMSGWLDRIAEAYYGCPRRYMGPLIPNNGDERFPTVHLNGVSVYPHDAAKDLKPYFPSDKSWDIISHSTTVRMAQDTRLIQQFWGPDRTSSPTFRSNPRMEEEPKNIVTRSFLKSDAVLFHRCKDGSLIDLLRAGSDADGGPTQGTEGQFSETDEFTPPLPPAPKTKGPARSAPLPPALKIG